MVELRHETQHRALAELGALSIWQGDFAGIAK
jgi:hypothetical protein